MQVPWFFAVRPTAPRSPWWTRLAERYVAWTERSHGQLRFHRSGL